MGSGWQNGGVVLRLGERGLYVFYVRRKLKSARNWRIGRVLVFRFFPVRSPLYAPAEISAHAHASKRRKPSQPAVFQPDSEGGQSQDSVDGSHMTIVRPVRLFAR